MTAERPPKELNLLPFLLLALAIHLLVLFGPAWWSPAPIPEEHHYVEVSLVELPPPPPPAPPPVAPPLPNTPILGLAPGIKSDKPATPAAAMAPVPTPETPGSPDAVMVQQAAKQIGPDTPGAMWGTGQGAGGGGGDRFKVIAVPDGLPWIDVEVAALAWDGRPAYLDSEATEQAVFHLVDDPRYWRNSPIRRVGGDDSDTANFGPWMGGDFRFTPIPERAYKSAGIKWTGSVPGPDRSILPPGSEGYEQIRDNNYDPGIISSDQTDYTGVVIFKGPGPNLRAPNVAQTYNLMIANGFVVEYAPPTTLRADDISLAKGHWQNHTYEVFAVAPGSPGINWVDAEKQARARGGYLAIIRSAEENDFVYSLTLQKPGAWRSDNDFDFTYRRTIVFDNGPWLGGIRVAETSRNPEHGKEPDYWWFHFATRPEDTGLSTDFIPHPYFNSRLATIQLSAPIQSHPDFPAGLEALCYGKLHTQTLATWIHLEIHSFTRGYVVEYDDPPGAAH